MFFLGTNIVEFQVKLLLATAASHVDTSSGAGIPLFIQLHTWEGSGKCPKSLGIIPLNWRDLDEVPGSWLWSDPIPDVVTIQKVVQ